MADAPHIQFKQSPAQFVRAWRTERTLSTVGRIISFGVLALSLITFILQTIQASGNGEFPVLSLWNSEPLTHVTWLLFLADIGALYLLDEIRRREHYSSKDDVFSYLDHASRSFIAQSLGAAAAQGQQLNQLMILQLMMQTSYMRVLLSHLELNVEAVQTSLQGALTPPATPSTAHEAQLSPELQNYLAISATRAIARGDASFGLPDLFLTLLEKEPTVLQFFEPLSITPERFAVVLGWLSTKDHLFQEYHHLKEQRMHTGPKNQAWTSVPTPHLDRFGHDLTISAAYGNVPLISVRDKEVEEAIRVLSRSTKSSLLIVGEPGVGKTAIVERIALRMLGEGVPVALHDKRLVQLDVAALHGSGEGFSAAFEQVLNEAERAGNVILFIPNLQDLATEQSSGVAVAELLLPILERSRMQVIGATTVKEYHEQIEQNASFSKAFGVVEVPEMDEKSAVVVLEEAAMQLEARHHVTISLKAIQAAVSLSAQYIHDRVLPEKAIEVLDESAVMAAAAKRPIVTESDVRTVLSQKTNVPISDVQKGEQDLLLNLETVLKTRVVGQDQAVSAVSQSLRRARAGLSDSNRPIGTFLFVGPTGVGKTELARALSEVYFHGQEAMVRLDMSEFQDERSISRLIGTANTDGLLTAPVRTHPFTLLLLDEFEKGSDSVRNLFLQVFDEGRITDGAGHVIDFKTSIIIATSNAGSLEIQESLRAGATYEQVQQTLVSTILPQIFRPELLNRFDGVIVFKPLSTGEITAIAKLQIQQVIEQTYKTSGVKLQVTDGVIEQLAAAGFDPTLGGRPLRRVIQDKLEAPLANKILAGQARRGQTVTIDVGDLSA